ncbi:hypothetical protein H5410_022240 [Solanum commersonii]|uniref:Uncharacterized protein n=1 Tax=Solanum commersonii TaxID=4109 RepID=A0A9J5ZG80_SOLCO|nr:hypothetical protein H5410_022240 [Solanum commersonii]
MVLGILRGNFSVYRGEEIDGGMEKFKEKWKQRRLLIYNWWSARTRRRSRRIRKSIRGRDSVLGDLKNYESYQNLGYRKYFKVEEINHAILVALVGEEQSNQMRFWWSFGKALTR